MVLAVVELVCHCFAKSKWVLTSPTWILWYIILVLVSYLYSSQVLGITGVFSYNTCIVFVSQILVAKIAHTTHTDTTLTLLLITPAIEET